MTINLKDIPYDLEEMIDEGEHILGDYSDEFETAMIENGLMDYGHVRRSHRIITSKCEELGYEGTLELLTGKTIREIELENQIEADKDDIKDMFEYAERYGYELKKKTLTQKEMYDRQYRRAWDCYGCDEMSDDKLSRLSNMFAVKNTWKEFIKQGK